MQESLELVMKEMEDIKKLLKKLESQLILNTEVTNHMHAKVSDISSKYDYNMAAPGSSKSKKGAAKDSEKKKVNIMTFFKNKYKEDASYFENIISEEEINKILEDHADEIEKKKKKKQPLDTYIPQLLYKYIKDDDKKMKLLRSMKDEDDNKNADNEEIKETNVDSSDEETDSE